MTTAVIALAGVESHACGNSITPKRHQHGVDDAEAAVEDPSPDERADGGGQHPGQQRQRPQRAAARKFLVHHQRPAEPQHHGARRRSDDVDRCRDEGAEDGRIGEHGREVRQPDEERRLRIDSVLVERQRERPHERPEDHPCEGDERGQEKQAAELLLPRLQPAPIRMRRHAHRGARCIGWGVVAGRRRATSRISNLSMGKCDARRATVIRA